MRVFVVGRRLRAPIAVAGGVVIAIALSAWLLAVTLRSHERFILPEGKWSSVQVQLYHNGRLMSGVEGPTQGRARRLVSAIRAEHGAPAPYPSIRSCLYASRAYDGPPMFVDVVHLYSTSHWAAKPYVVAAACGLVLVPRVEASERGAAIRELVKVPGSSSKTAVRRWLRDWTALPDTAGVGSQAESMAFGAAPLDV